MPEITLNQAQERQYTPEEIELFLSIKRIPSYFYKQKEYSSLTVAQKQRYQHFLNDWDAADERKNLFKESNKECRQYRGLIKSHP